MTTSMRVPTDDERALGWLKRQLEWEGILAALRDARTGADLPSADRPQRREPAAA